LEVNLPQQTINFLATVTSESFDINEYKKDNMQHGFDDIDYLINMSAEIEGFAASR
jgi:3-isopropylmalate/(R)-2-methylmalate dehydratase small subunit